MSVRAILAVVAGGALIYAGGKVKEAMRNYKIERENPAMDMVKDPRCGKYVAREMAVVRSSGPETLYFCSDGCARAHAGKA